MQQMRGHSSEMIRELNKRVPKCWKWVDYVLSKQCVKDNLKKEVVLALLNKSLPNKIEADLNVQGRIDHYFENNAEELDSAQEAILSRFAARAGASSN